MIEGLKEAKRPVVLCSFGKDSLLLLDMAREIRPDIDILWFRQDTANQQSVKRYIRDNNLKVLSYAPADKYFLPEGDDLVLVHEYDTGTERLSVIHSIEHSDDCGLLLNPKRTPKFQWLWDLALVGWKKCDDPSIALSLPLRTTLSGIPVIAPLYEYTDEEVLSELARRQIQLPQDIGAADSRMCTNCVNGRDSMVFCPLKGEMIPLYQWDKQAALKAFQQRLENEEQK